MTGLARAQPIVDAFPTRAGCRVTPLIEAADMYPSLERMVLGATRSVWLGFRIFDPATRLRSDEARAQGLADWAGLLIDAIGRGVEVRILLTDFEPLMADGLHAGSWRSFHRLRDAAERLAPDARARLQMIVIQHEGEIGWLWRQALRLPLRIASRRLVTRLLGPDEDDPGITARPGLWRYLAWEAERPKGWRPAPPPRMWPATYHQKFAVIDGRVAVIGGLDLNERRYDDARHAQRADRTWHDISARVEGPVVGDAGRHFAELWNCELPRFREIVAEWTQGARPIALDPLDRAVPPPVPPMLPDGIADVRLVRTRSRRSASILAFGPRPHIRELEAAHRALILGARRMLYIEAQFFRSQAASRWVVEALARNPELEVIILVANAPEEVAFEGQGGNPAHRHGEWLQTRALGRIRRAAGRDRVGLFTLAKQEPVRASETQFEDVRGTAYGSGLIHIHAKLLIADDLTCLLSSANINGRSFAWDTELGIVWREESEAVARFRRALWSQLFGVPTDADMDLRGWRERAAINARTAPAERTGFVVPYQLQRARRFARPYWFVPDDLV